MMRNWVRGIFFDDMVGPMCDEFLDVGDYDKYQNEETLSTQEYKISPHTDSECCFRLFVYSLIFLKHAPTALFDTVDAITLVDSLIACDETRLDSLTVSLVF